MFSHDDANKKNKALQDTLNQAFIAIWNDYFANKYGQINAASALEAICQSAQYVDEKDAGFASHLITYYRAAKYLHFYTAASILEKWVQGISHLSEYHKTFANKLDKVIDFAKNLNKVTYNFNNNLYRPDFKKIKPSTEAMDSNKQPTTSPKPF